MRRFNEQKNEQAGDHYTPREVIRLMVDLVFDEDDDALSKPGIVRTVFDPACGTGGMLSVADEYLRELHPQAQLALFGQDWNEESYAICKSDMLMSGQDPANIVKGDSFTQDGFAGRTFDYMLSNPPFGVDWKAIEKPIRDERDRLGFAGRFGAGLPRINDGSFLFLQHMISKMKPPEQGGSRLAIVFNGSPLFTGGAGSGESEIRRWIIENDWLEAVVALPDQLFYNTGISTYFWVVTNRKSPERRGRSNWSTPANCGSRCARAWARSARRSAPTRSPRSPASTAPSRRTTGSRSCPTSRSGIFGSRSNAHCAFDGRSPTIPLPLCAHHPSLPSSTRMRLTASLLG
ncbi:MAG TPA: class I SAM-dependent DNA methyltransferase [Acidimicrobiia bacterium]|nr:class I SAM-dependent DNA methyltransferase [Acidimicrobiia bacterium]